MKKVGLASRNIVHLPKKKHFRLCRFLPIYILNFNAVEGGSRGGKCCGVGQRRLSPGSFQNGPENQENTEK